MTDSLTENDRHQEFMTGGIHVFPTVEEDDHCLTGQTCSCDPGFQPELVDNQIVWYVVHRQLRGRDC